jgi:2-amino-4-hydroxy-6-hydroxymethyldihydropteridine diphosphokinase
VALRAVIGLGANLGDRLEQLRAAVRAMRKIGKIERLSRVYETEPVGPPQPSYLNAAALLVYEGTPENLLDALLGIERMLGRARREKWGPRTIDLDVLWIEGMALETERLAVPHPQLTARGFALRPLADVAPDAIDPVSGNPYGRLPAAADPGVRPTAHDLSGPS